MLCRLLFLHSRWANCLIRSPGQMCLFYVKITYSYHVSSMKIHRKGLLPYISYIGMRLPQRVWFLNRFRLRTGIDFDHYGLNRVWFLREPREGMNVFVFSTPNE